MTLILIVPICFAAVAFVFWIRTLPIIRGTTLVGPWYWSLIAMSVSVGVTCAMLLSGHKDKYLTSTSALEYLAAITAFCPTMSVLGARRPHHYAWNFVVIALWCVLALPAAQAALLRPGEPVIVHGLFACFIGILILAEILNRCWTTLCVLGLFQAICEMLLLGPHVLPSAPLTDLHWSGGIVCQCLVVMAVGHFHVRRRRPWSWAALWFSFRDSYGLLWSLRVAEQMNRTAALLDWPARLTWTGFRSTSDSQWGDLVNNQEKRAAFERAFVNLLRRFLNEDDIQQAIKNPY